MMLNIIQASKEMINFKFGCLVLQKVNNENKTWFFKQTENCTLKIVCATVIESRIKARLK